MCVCYPTCKMAMGFVQRRQAFPTARCNFRKDDWVKMQQRGGVLYLSCAGNIVRIFPGRPRSQDVLVAFMHSNASLGALYFFESHDSLERPRPVELLVEIPRFTPIVSNSGYCFVFLLSPTCTEPLRFLKDLWRLRQIKDTIVRL